MRSRGTLLSSDWRGAPPHDQRLEHAGAADGPVSTPWDAPLVPPFPIGFRNMSILTAAWRTDPVAIARLLPPPLEPIGDVVLAHIYLMPDTDFVGRAHECNVMFGARLTPGRPERRGRLLDGPLSRLRRRRRARARGSRATEEARVAEARDARRSDRRRGRAKRDHDSDGDPAVQTARRGSGGDATTFRFHREHQLQADSRTSTGHPRSGSSRRDGCRMFGFTNAGPARARSSSARTLRHPSGGCR